MKIKVGNLIKVKYAGTITGINGCDEVEVETADGATHMFYQHSDHVKVKRIERAALEFEVGVLYQDIDGELARCVGEREIRTISGNEARRGVDINRWRKVELPYDRQPW